MRRKSSVPTSKGENIITALRGILFGLIGNSVYSTNFNFGNPEAYLLSTFIQALTGKQTNNILSQYSYLQESMRQNNRELLCTILKNFDPEGVITKEHREYIHAYYSAPIQKITCGPSNEMIIKYYDPNTNEEVQEDGGPLPQAHSNNNSNSNHNNLSKYFFTIMRHSRESGNDNK
jgi:hypothetical protein